MSFLVLGVILSVVITIVLLLVFACSDSDVLLGLGIISSIGSAVLLLILVFWGFEYKASEYKASIINREYGTNYTKQEIFYAEDVIDTIREIDRERLEINGNLIKGE